MRKKLKDYVKILLFTIILAHSFLTYSQVFKEGVRVTMPLQLYRDVRKKVLICDTLLNEYENQIYIKDSIISEQFKKEEEYNKIINSKDTTIKTLKLEISTLAEKKKPKFYERKETWVVALVSFALGVFLSR